MSVAVVPGSSSLPSSQATIWCCMQIDFNLLGMGLVRFDRVLFRGALPARAHPPAAGWDVLYGSGSTARGGAAASRPHVRHVAMELEEDERLRAAAGGGGSGGGCGAGGSSAGSGGGDVPVTPSQTPPDAMAMAAAVAAAAAAAAFAAVSGSLRGSGGGGATQGTPGGSGGGLSSSARQELQRRVEGMLWTVHTTPQDWTWAGAALPSRVKWV